MSDTLQFVVVIRKTQVTLQLDRPASRRQTEVCRTFATALFDLQFSDSAQFFSQLRQWVDGSGPSTQTVQSESGAREMTSRGITQVRSRRARGGLTLFAMIRHIT